MSSAVGSGGSSASIAGNSTGSGSGSGALSGSGCDSAGRDSAGRDSAGCGPGASASASTSATGFSFHGSTPGSERTSGSVPDFVAAFTAAAGSRDPSKNAKTATAPVQASASAIAMIPGLSGTRATFRLSRLPLPPAPADHGQPGRGRDDTQYGQPEQGQPTRVGQVLVRRRALDDLLLQAHLDPGPYLRVREIGHVPVLPSAPTPEQHQQVVAIEGREVVDIGLVRIVVGPLSAAAIDA